MALGNAPESGYGVILADPPWSFVTYSEKGKEKKSAENHYPCMGLQEIKNLPITALAAKDCALVLWVTAPFFEKGLEVMRAWGFTYKTIGAWAKRSRQDNSWAFGTGYIYRNAAEFWIVGTRGKPTIKSRSVRNLIVAPIREHSRKPDEMRENIEAIWEGPYLELFARERAPNWDVWGNETDKFSKKTLITKAE